MKKYKIKCTSFGAISNAVDGFDIELINILTDLGKSIDPQGYDDGEYDIAIYKIKELIKKYNKI